MSEKIAYSIQNVSKSFEVKKDTLTAVENITFDIRENELVSILGISGCGKSTLLRMIGGFEKPTTGQIVKGNGEIIEGPGSDRGMVFQSYTLFPWLTVKKNVEYGLKQKKLPKKEIEEISNRFLAEVGLSDFKNHYPKELSGGMKQRVAIARALANDPDSLLLDEPFGALDAQTRVLMQELTLDIWSKNPKTIIMVTHDIDEAIFMSDRILVMTARPGSIREVIDIDIPRPRSHSIKSDQRFIDLKSHCLDLIYEESLKSDATMRAFVK